MLFIYNNLEEAARREFEQAGLHIKCVDGNRYLGVYFRPREDLESWGRPNVETWAHGKKMLLQTESQYLQRILPGVGTIIGPIEDALREAFLPALSGGEEVSDDLREILGHKVKRGGLNLPYPCLSVDHAYKSV